MAHGIGLSIGATALRAVVVGRSALTRSPVLTRYPHRPPEVGVPAENPNLTERGLVITDFVDRVGDPVAIVAGDGSSHRAEALLAEALRALRDALTGRGPVDEPLGVTHPAHWSPSAVAALRRALEEQTLLTSDAVAGLVAMRDDPGLPTRGVVALCDVGGSGASITLADAANGYQPIGPTVRSTDFSGDLVDQALLTRVVGDLAGSGAVDASSTSAIGNLSRLRGECRGAKERLSTTAATSLPVELSGRRTEVRVTRTELDDAIRGPLDGLVDLLQETLQRSGIRAGDLAAVASVGGSARLPMLTTTLSERLRVPVVTSAQPELAAAIGGGLTAARGRVPDVATALAPAAPPPTAAAPVAAAGPASSAFRALAWSQADDSPEPEPAPDEPYEPYEPYEPRPVLAFTESEDDAAHATAPAPWYRGPVGLLAAGAVVALLAAGGAAYYLLRDDGSPTTSSPSTSVAPSTSAAPAATDPSASEQPPSASQAPPPEQTVYQQAPQPPVTVTQGAPPATETPAPTTEAPPPPTTTDPPPVTVTETQTQTPSPSSSTRQPVIPTLPYQTIPGLPFVPAPIQPPSP